MSYFFWLGIEAEQFHCPAEILFGDSEEDGWITIYPDVGRS